MDRHKLERPDFSSIDTAGVLKEFTENPQNKYSAIMQVSEPRYLYWDEVRFKSMPTDMNHLKFWYLVKQIRKISSRPTFLIAENGKPFVWLRLTYTDEFLHKIDTHTGGQIFATSEVISQENRQKFVSRGILEEAIASSQLEGANTTRAAAKQMILEKRQPRNRSERMIVNNYNTMVVLDREYKKKELSNDLLFELHHLITKDTVPADQQDRYRRDSDDIVVQNSKYITHIPPSESFLNRQMSRLIDYANDKEGGGFIHPIIKAIFLHFWVGYLHPFTDGNGRLARALFYWYLLKNNYWTFMYLPISSIIKKSPIQYSNAYIYTEQDDLDLTYFYDYQMRKIMQSIDEFNIYLDKVVNENKQIDSLLGKEYIMNERQKQIIHYLLVKDEYAYVTTSSHGTLNRIGRITSAKDLKYLTEMGLLTSKKVGKFVHYFSSDTLKNLSGVNATR